MRSIILCILCVVLHIPIAANATIIEFNSDGSVTTFEARDYLADARRQQKKPMVFKSVAYRKPKDNFNRFVQAAALKTNRPYFYLYFLFKINNLIILTFPVYTYTSVTHFLTQKGGA